MLDGPVITWAVRRDSDNDFQENDDFFAGTFSRSSGFTVEFEIWNNRHGTKEVQDLQDFSVEFSFDDIEDSALINCCSFVIGETQVVTPILNGYTGVLRMPENVILSGAVNDGSEDSTLNYVRLKMFLEVPNGKGIKMNDLKSMTFNITRL